MSHELHASAIRVRYGNAEAVRGVDVVIPGGSITAIVGPNGAGKSSLVLALYGSVPATGKVSLDDKDVSGLRAVERAKRGISIVPQGRQLFPRLSVRENLRVMAQTLKLPSGRVEQALERFPILETRAKSLAGVLSGGEQQMLVVSRALMCDPKILLLDEVSTGLAPIIVEEIAHTIVALAADGVGVLLAAPEIGALAPIINRGYVMIRGEIAATEEADGEALNSTYQAAMGLELAESVSGL